MLEFESQTEARINTVLNTILGKTEQGENEKASSKKENESNAGKSKPSKIKKEKTKKIYPGFVTFLYNYHKAFWAAKYSSVLIRENEDDEIEVCEEVSLLILIFFIYLHKSTKTK